MNRKKLVTTLLAFSLVLSSFAATGCGKKEQTKEKVRRPTQITKEMPWFSTGSFEVGEKYRKEGLVNSYDAEYIGLDGDKICYLTTGEYKYPLDGDLSSINYNDYLFADLDIYDLDGKLFRSIDVHSGLDLSPFVPEGQQVKDCFIEARNALFKDGKLYLNASVFLAPLNASIIYAVIYDVNSGKIESAVETSEESGTESNLFCNWSVSFEGYTIDSYTSMDEEMNPYVRVTRPDGTSKMADIRKSGSVVDILDINRIIYLGGGKALMMVFDSGYNTAYYMLDLNSLKISRYKDETSWFESYFNFYDPSYIDGTGYVFSTHNSVNRIDFDKKEIIELLSFDFCNINRKAVDGLEVVAATDDRIVLTGTETLNWNYGQVQLQSMVYVLTKEKENPHAGKTVLTVASFYGYDEAFCEALCRFNETNPDYFIMADNSYSYWDKSIDGSMDNITDENGYLKFESSLSLQLAMDLMAGEGPDLILGADSYRQLNSDDYLIDLSKEIDTEGLFANIIESSKTGGKLYQVPLAVGADGIAVRRSSVGDGRTGFTYDQYKDFVRTVCNGEDPVYYGQNAYFTACLRYLYKDCVTGSGADFGNSKVKELADFVKDNVPESLKEVENGYSATELPGGRFIDISSFNVFLENFKGLGVEDIAYLGLPSCDGQGPMLRISSSIAISSKTKAKDDLVEFVKSLLSEEVQTIYGMEDSTTPVNIAAFEKVAENDLDKANTEIREYVKMNAAGIYYAENIPRTEIDPVVIQNYKDMISSCAVYQDIDPAIIIIVNEEMPAYFTGQKSFDDVVNLINNRVTTVLNEQG